MYKIFFLLCSSFLLLSARENPFFPAKHTKQLNITSNQIKTYTPLTTIPLSLPSSARVLQEVTLKFINIDGSVGSKTIYVQNGIDWHKPVIISQPEVISSQTSTKQVALQERSKPLKVIAFHDFITMNVFFKDIEIITKDKTIRHFMMVDPYRIVIDFKRNSNFLSYAEKIKKSVCTHIAIGNHDGYYRVVFFLDGQYHFHFKTTKNGYSLQLY